MLIAVMVRKFILEFAFNRDFAFSVRARLLKIS